MVMILVVMMPLILITFDSELHLITILISRRVWMIMHSIELVDVLVLKFHDVKINFFRMLVHEVQEPLIEHSI